MPCVASGAQPSSRDLHERLLAGSERLFEDVRAVQELEGWCLRVIEEVRAVFPS